jgi:exopolysaccharide biosynthesis protein
MISRVAAAAAIAGALWHPVRPGVWVSESQMADEGPLSVVRSIAIRVDAARYRFRLDTATRDDGMRGAWTVASMPDDAVIAFNAGQFNAGFPWGWVVRDGVESQAPGSGKLAMAFTVDRDGTAELLEPSEIPSRRGRIALAFQSYPALLVDGAMPRELRASGRGVNVEHRDSRLAVCTLAGGGLLIVITRFTGFGARGETLPWGPTVPEMAEHMRSRGCNRAMLLDGGLSSQLAVRDHDGKLMRWTNWRPVPLGLVIAACPATCKRR